MGSVQIREAGYANLFDSTGQQEETVGKRKRGRDGCFSFEATGFERAHCRRVAANSTPVWQQLPHQNNLIPGLTAADTAPKITGLDSSPEPLDGSLHDDLCALLDGDPLSEFRDDAPLPAVTTDPESSLSHGKLPGLGIFLDDLVDAPPVAGELWEGEDSGLEQGAGTDEVNSPLSWSLQIDVAGYASAGQAIEAYFRKWSEPHQWCPSDCAVSLTSAHLGLVDGCHASATFASADSGLEATPHLQYGVAPQLFACNPLHSLPTSAFSPQVHLPLDLILALDTADDESRLRDKVIELADGSEAYAIERTGLSLPQVQPNYDPGARRIWPCKRREVSPLLLSKIVQQVAALTSSHSHDHSANSAGDLTSIFPRCGRYLEDNFSQNHPESVRQVSLTYGRKRRRVAFVHACRDLSRQVQMRLLFAFLPENTLELLERVQACLATRRR